MSLSAEKPSTAVVAQRGNIWLLCAQLFRGFPEPDFWPG